MRILRVSVTGCREKELCKVVKAPVLCMVSSAGVIPTNLHVNFAYMWQSAHPGVLPIVIHKKPLKFVAWVICDLMK